jgi:hypothetical protein
MLCFASAQDRTNPRRIKGYFNANGDRAGRLDVSAARIAFAASLSGVEALLNPMPVQDAAR